MQEVILVMVDSKKSLQEEILILILLGWVQMVVLIEIGVEYRWKSLFSQFLAHSAYEMWVAMIEVVAFFIDFFTI